MILIVCLKNKGADQSVLHMFRLFSAFYVSFKICNYSISYVIF